MSILLLELELALNLCTEAKAQELRNKIKEIIGE